jgi:hypothetical protein
MDESPEDFFGVTVPPYTPNIIEYLKTKDYLIHNLNCTDEHIYDLISFIKGKMIEKRKYTILLDLNVYEYLMSGIRKGKKNPYHLWAISLLIYCQIAEIEIDPKYAIYEKIKYDKTKVDEVKNDLALFHNLNNQNTDTLAEYLLTDKEQLEIIDIVEYNDVNLVNWHNKFTRLIEWDSLYVHILAITSILIKNPNGKELNLKEYLDWSINDFRLSNGGIAFASVLFAIKFPNSKDRKGLMKYKKTDPIEKRKNDLINMTWDLYFIVQFFRQWTGKKENEEYLFASADTALKTVLRLAIKVQNEQSFSCFKEFLSSETVDEIENIEIKASKILNRIYKSDDKWTPEYRASLIEQFENELLC